MFLFDMIALGGACLKQGLGDIISSHTLQKVRVSNITCLRIIVFYNIIYVQQLLRVMSVPQLQSACNVCSTATVCMQCLFLSYCLLVMSVPHLRSACKVFFTATVCKVFFTQSTEGIAVVSPPSLLHWYRVYRP